MKLRILTVGKLKKGEIKSVIESYTKRLRPPYKIDFLDVKISKSKEIPRVKTEEGKALISKIGKDFASGSASKDFVVVLDERGDQLSSIQFSKELTKWLDAGKNVSFVIGGAAGLSHEVLEKANKRISLSKMVLPHDLALLVLVEQIYRAMTIASGIPYHK